MKKIKPPSLQQRAKYLMKKYGLYLEEYDRLYAAQNGRCAICQDAVTQLAVDHCHEETTIRGLLCRSCNIGLGCFKDRADVVMDAAAYLLRERPLVKTQRVARPLIRRKR